MVTSDNQSTNRARLGFFFSLFLLFLCIYLATYSGRIESGDSLRVVDSASSLVHFGDTKRDESLWQDTPEVFFDNIEFPITPYEPKEPLIAYIAAIPYAIATLFPQIGLAHATWLLNIVVIAFSVALFYLLARIKNYDEITAIIAAILLGLGTILWVYSKTLFREPMIVLFFLIVAIALELWRRNYLRIGWLILAIVAFIAAYFTKNSSLFALPAFVIWILPNWQMPKKLGWLLDSLLLLGIVLLTLSAFVEPVFRFFADITSAVYPINLQFARIALHSYLFSIGGSIWATSPILLLSIVGAIMLIRRGQRRILWATVFILTAYAVAHALLTGVHWFGGLSYPPRFLLPVVPFAMLPVLPIIQWLQQPNTVLWRIPVTMLAIVSIAFQIIASLSLLDAYVELLPTESGGLVEWLPGLNQIQYARWLLLPQSWANLGWDIAWSRINAEYIAIALLIVAFILSLGILFRRKWLLWLNVAATVSVLVLLGFGLRLLYQDDVRYWAQTPELFDMLTILEREATPVEPLLFASSADNTYERFILNYNRLSNVRPMALGFQVGERASPADSPAVTSDFTRNLITFEVLPIIDHIASNHERIWWLAYNGSFTQWAIRPEERYLTENHYLVNEYTTINPTVRLLEFSTVPAPNRYEFRLPENVSDFRFGEYITLEGYTLPLGQNYQAGQIVPITFFWQTDTLLDTDYTVAWFLVNESVGYIQQGIDSMPDASFSPTTSWQSNQLIYDNRAIELRTDVPSGIYQIWLRLYETNSGGENQLMVTGGDTYEGTTAILPMTIQAAESN